jgi:hypothetical protein
MSCAIKSNVPTTTSLFLFSLFVCLFFIRVCTANVSTTTLLRTCCWWAYSRRSKKRKRTQKSDRHYLLFCGGNLLCRVCCCSLANAEQSPTYPPLSLQKRGKEEQERSKFSEDWAESDVRVCMCVSHRSPPSPSSLFFLSSSLHLRLLVCERASALVCVFVCYSSVKHFFSSI